MKLNRKYAIRKNTSGRPIVLTKAGEEFIRDNFSKLTNQQLADVFGVSLDKMRVILHGKRMLRMELEYWTDEQVQFLKDHYQCIGDKEMAHIFQLNWAKKKNWTLKHIEKKRKYLNLKRTKEEIDFIRARNVLLGCWQDMATWNTREAAKLGEIRIWKASKRANQEANQVFKVIKTEKGFVHYMPWLWQQHNGPVPKGMKVTTIDGNNMNVVIENLQIITQAEQGKRLGNIASTALSDNYIAGQLTNRKPEIRKEVRANKQLLQFKRTQLELQRAIKKNKV